MLENLALKVVQASAMKEVEVGATDHVVNESSGIWHAILVGPPTAELSEWGSACGWAFGMSRRARIASATELPRDPKLLCQNCFASLRGELKAAHAEEMRRQDGVGGRL